MQTGESRRASWGSGFKRVQGVALWLMFPRVLTVFSPFLYVSCLPPLPHTHPLAIFSVPLYEFGRQNTKEGTSPRWHRQ